MTVAKCRLCGAEEPRRATGQNCSFCGGMMHEHVKTSAVTETYHLDDGRGRARCGAQAPGMYVIEKENRVTCPTCVASGARDSAPMPLLGIAAHANGNGGGASAIDADSLLTTARRIVEEVLADPRSSKRARQVAWAFRAVDDAAMKRELPTAWR